MSSWNVAESKFNILKFHWFPPHPTLFSPELYLWCWMRRRWISLMIQIGLWLGAVLLFSHLKRIPFFLFKKIPSRKSWKRRWSDRKWSSISGEDDRWREKSADSNEATSRRLPERPGFVSWPGAQLPAAAAKCWKEETTAEAATQIDVIITILGMLKQCTFDCQFVY